MKIHPGWLAALFAVQSHAGTPASLLVLETAPVVSAQMVSNTAPVFADIPSFHAEYVHRFETVPEFGWERTLRPSFRSLPSVLSWNGSILQGEPPHLIGLEDGPKAYQPLFPSGISLREMTNHSMRAQLKTRPLTAFESNALPRLIAGTPFVALSGERKASVSATNPPPDLRILARLDAGPTCAKCHECQEGTMLGAFSYSLHIAAPPGGTSNAASSPIASVVAR